MVNGQILEVTKIDVPLTLRTHK